MRYYPELEELAKLDPRVLCQELEEVTPHVHRAAAILGVMYSHIGAGSPAAGALLEALEKSGFGLRAGQRIVHPRLGPGTVLRSSPTGEVVIQFAHQKKPSTIVPLLVRQLDS